MDKETTHLMATTTSPKLALGTSYKTWAAPVIASTSTNVSWSPYIVASGTGYISSPVPSYLTCTYKLVEQITGEELKKWCESFVADKLNFDA
jgi:hypothetical protein